MKKENNLNKAKVTAIAYKNAIRALENKKASLLKELETVEAVISTLGENQEIFVYQTIADAIHSGKHVRNFALENA